MSILDFLFPKKCAGCGKHGTYFCSECATGARLYEGSTPQGTIIIWKYEGAPRRLIHKVKYKFVKEAAFALAEAAAKHLKKYGRTQFLLVPIPLHWTRKNWRGFNHTEEIGKILSQIMGWRFQNLLVRKKSTKPQVGLKKGERRQNVTGVFAINSQYSKSQLQDSILLFDDVWTTGSTMLEAEKVLKKAGFKKVWRLALAG